MKSENLAHSLQQRRQQHQFTLDNSHNVHKIIIGNTSVEKTDTRYIILSNKDEVKEVVQ